MSLGTGALSTGVLGAGAVSGLLPGQAAIVVAGQTPTTSRGFAGTATQGSITLAGQSPTIAAGHTSTAAQGTITVTGQTPKTFLDTFKKTPVQGSISVTGQTPSVSLGHVLLPGQRAISLIGQTPTTLIRISTPVYITGRTFKTTASVLGAPEYPNYVVGGSISTNPAIYGGAIATGYGFKTTFSATVAVNDVGYVTGYGFSTAPSIRVIPASNTTISGRGFTTSPQIYGGAVVTGANFTSAIITQASAPESATVTGYAFNTAQTIVGYGSESARVVGGTFLVGLSYATVAGNTLRSAPIINADFTVDYAEAFVMNITTKAVSRYQNYPFFHITKLNGSYYGVSANGLHELSGAWDLTTPINGVIKTNDEDLAKFNSKNIPYVYLNGDDDYSVTAIVDEVVQPTFTTGFGGRRAKMARGSKGRYWYFQIEGIGALQGLETLPDGLSRKVK